MGFRFRKSVKLAPGVRLNFSKSGVSTSLGGPGATVNFGKRGTRHTVGVPGTGMSFSSFTTKKSGGGTPDGTATTNTDTTLGCGCLVLIGFAILLLSQCGSSEETESSPSQETSQTNSQEDTEPASGDALLYPPNETVYVTASSLNGRSKPSTSGEVVMKLPHGSSARVVDRSGEWLKVAAEATTVWVAASHVSSYRPQQLYSPPARRSSASRGNYFDGNCPCSGSRVCIGPRGGRYCITSGGNKRYGV
jgi:hypothetical protein